MANSCVILVLTLLALLALTAHAQPFARRSKQRPSPQLPSFGHSTAADDFVVPPPLLTVAHKAQTLPLQQWTTIASASGCGIIRRIWLAAIGSSAANLYINGRFDGASVPQIGSWATTSNGTDSPLSLDILFTSVFPPSASLNYSGTFAWSTSRSGSNMLNDFEMDGYLMHDMPFSDGFELSLYSAQAPGAFWVMVDYTPLPTPPATPYRLHIQPYAVSNVSNDPSTHTFPEISLLSVSSPIGVVFKGLKFAVLASTRGISFAEGKFRFYSGGPGLPVNSVNVYTAPGPSELSYYNQVKGATMLGSSSGTEDFFLNGYDWYNSPCYATDEAGTVHCGFYDPDMSRLAAYRFYNTAAYYAPPQQPLVVTFTVNDQNFEVARGGTQGGAVPAALTSALDSAACRLFASCAASGAVFRGVDPRLHFLLRLSAAASTEQQATISIRIVSQLPGCSLQAVKAAIHCPAVDYGAAMESGSLALEWMADLGGLSWGGSTSTLHCDHAHLAVRDTETGVETSHGDHDAAVDADCCSVETDASVLGEDAIIAGTVRKPDGTIAQWK